MFPNEIAHKVLVFCTLHKNNMKWCMFMLMQMQCNYGAKHLRCYTTRPIDLANFSSLWVPDRTHRSHEWSDAPVANPNTRAPDCCVELTGRVRSNHDRVRCSVRSPLWPTFAFVSFSTSGVVKNRHFNSSKTPESRARKLGGGREEPKPSLPLKLQRLRKCANTNKWSPPCARVLAFS
jgi:hypothetical protein